MKLIVPMAGKGSRFFNRGITLPKPLIPIAGEPMVSWALKSVSLISFSDIIFICLLNHENEHNISLQLQKYIKRDFQIVFINNVTEGQLCTVLAASRFFNCDEDILISSSDTYVISNLNEDIIGAKE